MTHFTIIFLIFLSSLGFASNDPIQADRHTINLDLPPEERWVEVLKRYADYVPKVKALLKVEIPPSIFPLAEKLASVIDQHIPAPYPGEMRGVAKAWNMSEADVILINLIYDLTAYCTSIVAQDSKGNIIHGRNLDYQFAKLLRRVTFMVDFQSKGKTLYSGVTFASMVGVFTAQSPGELTVSGDERDRGYVWENIFEAIFNKNALPVSFLMRESVSTGLEFEQAVALLSSKETIADIYFIVGGMKAGQGAVITRDRPKAADVWRLDTAKGRWFLVETNYDHWTTAPPSDDRRDVAIKTLKEVGQANITATALFKVLSTKLVLNNGTIYTTVMSAANPQLFNTWVRHP